MQIRWERIKNKNKKRIEILGNENKNKNQKMRNIFCTFYCSIFPRLPGHKVDIKTFGCEC